MRHHRGARGTALEYKKVSSVDYGDFVASKLTRAAPTGMAEVPALHPSLFPFQSDLVGWALRRGRCALFADTGLGKTRMQLEWAKHVAALAGDVLILAPLSVASQTANEAKQLGMSVTLCREAGDVRPGVNITNYDRLHKFATPQFVGVVLDESSCIKHYNSKTLAALMAAFGDTPWKLCCTATPSPNDYVELGTHAAFLGVCTQVEMMSEYFCVDRTDITWRLKGHARDAFWKFVASWGAMLRKPSDLGYDDERYALPPLRTHHHVSKADQALTFASGVLFATEATDLMDRRRARKDSLSSRVESCAKMVNADKNTWVLWCDLNAESDALAAAIPGSVEVRGSLDLDEKERILDSFARGEIRVLISKASITGFGLNWQHAHHMAFVGVTDSWEAYYQAVRRCWRFGQTKPVDVHVFASEVEGSVIKNLERKGKDAMKMAEELSRETGSALRAEVLGSKRGAHPYNANTAMVVPSWVKSGDEQ